MQLEFECRQAYVCDNRQGGDLVDALPVLAASQSTTINTLQSR